ncbi:hypothetical protein EDD21DRAFT_144518 [Dissophora ornata]|nr:hypothetical protein EDD21DRAFT_144518 [Dissophora ornata]
MSTLRCHYFAFIPAALGISAIGCCIAIVCSKRLDAFHPPVIQSNLNVVLVVLRIWPCFHSKNCHVSGGETHIHVLSLLTVILIIDDVEGLVEETQSVTDQSHKSIKKPLITEIRSNFLAFGESFTHIWPHADRLVHWPREKQAHEPQQEATHGYQFSGTSRAEWIVIHCPLMIKEDLQVLLAVFATNHF